MVGGVRLSASFLSKVLAQLGEAAPGSIGVNLLIPFLDRECVEAAASKVRVVEFFYGEPDAALAGACPAA